MDPAALPIPTRFEIERALSGIWRQVLAVPTCVRTDDFFAAGGDSLAATKLVAAIEAQFGVVLPASVLVDNPTPGHLAGRIETVLRSDESAETLASTLIPIRTEGSRPPLFLVHGLMGTVVFAHVLNQFLGEDQPLYAFRARGFDGQTPVATVHELSTLYLSQIREVQPIGPYFIGGNCSGSFIALEMCRALVTAGESVGMMLAIDPLEPGVSFTRHLLRTADNPVDERSPTFRANLRERLEREVFGSGSLGRQRMEWAIDVAVALDIAITNYQPEPYPGPVTLIASRDRAGPIGHPQSVWRRIAGKGTRIHHVPVPHLALFLDKGSVLADLVRKTMDGALHVAKAPTPVRPTHA